MAGDRTALGRALVVAVLLAAVLYQRVLITVDSGGRGVVSVFVPLTIVLGLACIWIDSAAARRVAWAKLFGVWGLYWACVALLPLLGVSAGSYPTRAAFSSVTDALVPFAVVAIGMRTAVLTREPSHTLSTPLAVAVVIVLAYAIGQWAYGSGVVSPGVWGPIAEWDRAAAEAFGVLQVSRSSGPYVNPNMLGAWGALVFVLSATLVQGRFARPVIMGAAILTVVFAQSRGSFVALIAGAVVVVLGARSGTGRSSRLKTLLLLMAAASVATLGFGVAGEGMPGVVRIVDGLLSLLPGTELDPNLAGRLDFWAAAGTLSAFYPLGTWGPPEMLLGSAVDNDWIRIYLQASVVGLAAVGIMLIGGGLTSDRSRPSGRALMACSVVIGVSALTQTPLAYPSIALYWLVVGFSIVSPLVAEQHGRQLSSEPADPVVGARARILGTVQRP